MKGRRITVLEKLRGIVELGEKFGAEEIEAYTSCIHQTVIKVHQTKVELYNSALTQGVGIRVFVGKKLGYSYTTDLEKQSLQEALKDALENAKLATPDNFNGLPASPADMTDQSLESQIYRPALSVTSPENKIEFALNLERRAVSLDQRIKSAEEVVYADQVNEIALVNSYGFEGSYRSTFCYGFITALAEERGERQIGFSYTMGRELRELELDKAAEEAVNHAVSLFGGKPLSSRKATIVLDSLAAAQVLASLSVAFTAESVQKGRSFLVGKEGKKIAASSISIVDDGRLERGPGTAPFDGEGILTARTEVVKEGYLNTLLYDTYTARKAGKRSTGNAGRTSFKSRPAPLPSNFFLQPGSLSKEEILSLVSEGLYVINVQGLHAGVNPISGQFSIGASGLWIKNGKVAFPVREVTIASTCQDLLKNIIAVGNDLRFIPVNGGIGAPTIAIEKMMISGR